jgi:hypothetical protein
MGYMENSLLGLLDPEEDGAVILQNVSNYLSFGTTLDARRFEFALEAVLPVSESHSYIHLRVGQVAQSVKRLIIGWMVRGSNPGGGKIFRTRPDRP